jgi:hypothetical protein
MFPHIQLILALGVGVAVATTGSTYELQLPASNQSSAPTLRLFGTFTQAGGATSPTGKVYFETSADGTTWHSQEISALATDASETIAGDLDVRVMRYARVKVVPAGGTAPTLTGNFWLASNSPVKFKLVP